MPPEDEDEFWAWFEMLSPREQEEIMYSEEFAGANQVPYSFEGAYSPSLDEGQYDLLSMDGGVAIPEMTSKGKVDPYDLSQAAKRFNLMQDYATGSVDNALAMFAGPGAYGPGAFEDTVTMPTDRVNDTGSRMLERYASSGGYEGYIAQKIRDEGTTPSQAYAELMELVTTEPTGEEPPEALAMREALIASMPRVVRDGPVPPGEEEAPYDVNRILDFGDELFQATFEDEEPAWVDPETGIGYKSPPEVERSKAAQWYDQRGLPTPNVGYDDPEYQERFMYAADPYLDENEEDRYFGIEDARARERAALAEDREADSIYQNQSKALRDFEALQAQEFRPAEFRQTFGQPRRAQGRSEGMSPEGLRGMTRAQPQLGNDGITRAPNLGRQTFDPMVGREAQMANAALTNLASQFQQEGFDPEYSGDRPTKPLMVNNRTGAVSATLGGIEDDPTAPFDFQTALGNPRKNEKLDKGKVSQSRRKRDTKSRAARSAITDRWRQEHVNMSREQGDVAYAVGLAQGLARSGRTPLQDALMQRVMGQRAMGGRG